LARSVLYISLDEITIHGIIVYVIVTNFVWTQHFVGQSLWEVFVMLDIIVGLIGVVLIIYLLATIIRPELF
jgi:hypothetical protein